MKLYDKVYVPLDNGRVTVKGNTAVCKWKSKPSEGGQFWEPQSEVKEEGAVIVLTLEELREVWNAAQDRACAMQMGEPGDTKIFESFLQSKGVIIP